MLKCLLLILSLLLLVPGAQAKLFDTPETVSYLGAEALLEASVVLESTGPMARATELEIWHTMPQTGGRQTAKLEAVEGPDSYRFESDSQGNRMIVLNWKDPPLDTEIDYSVSFGVEVWDRDEPAPEREFPLTQLTEPDEGIIERASGIAAGLPVMEKFMELTAFVFDYVEYDRSFQNTQRSASWVFSNRKAVCDGHANLLISMLRSLGYNAYYVIGYAYTEEGVDPDDPNYWGPHGWVEVGYDGRAVSLDPTWMQHPVDATHIRFAAAADSNYSEYVQTVGSGIRVNWDKGGYRIIPRDFSEEPRMAIELQAVPEEPGSGEHVLVGASLTSLEEPCVLSDIRLRSCETRGVPFMGSERIGSRSGFCRNSTQYWMLEVPDLKNGMQYICGVTVFGGGATGNLSLTASGEGDRITPRLSTVKVLSPGQFFNVNSTVENHGLAQEEIEMFLILDGQVQRHAMSLDGMQAADVAWRQRAPMRQGAYEMLFFVSSGALVREDIVVSSERSVMISSVSLPADVTAGTPVQMNVTIQGLGDSSGTVIATIGPEDFEMDFILSEGEQKRLTFLHTPESEGITRVTIVVLGREEQFEDGFSGSVAVESEHEFWDSLWKSIRGFLEWLLSGLGLMG